MVKIWIIVFLVLALIFFLSTRETILDLDQRGGEYQDLDRPKLFQNLCFTKKPRGYYFPSCSHWRPRHLTRLPEMALPSSHPSCSTGDTSVLTNNPFGPSEKNPRWWPGAQLGQVTFDCDGSVALPSFTNYEPSSYIDRAKFCQENPNQRLCPNHWIL